MATTTQDSQAAQLCVMMVSEGQIIGVVSGYQRDRQPVLDTTGHKGPYTYDLNTGVVVAYDARYIKDIVRKDPCGLHPIQTRSIRIEPYDIRSDFCEPDREC